MDLLDLIVIVVAVIAAVGGYRLGFFGRVASWLGLALGFYVAIRLLPSVLIRTWPPPRPAPSSPWPCCSWSAGP